MQPAGLDETSLITELRPALVAFFRRRCGDSAEAEDLAQDVVLRALQHASWESRDEAKGYIFKIAMNLWKDRGRRRLARGVQVGFDEGIDDLNEDIPQERQLGGQQEVKLLVSAISELGERTRDVLILCRVERMKKAEIADAMGISVSAVEKHLVRALAHLAKKVERDAN